jgi:hypothetical protein
MIIGDGLGSQYNPIPGFVTCGKERLASTLLLRLSSHRNVAPTGQHFRRRNSAGRIEVEQDATTTILPVVI